jgi:hypothetical protein
LGKDIDFLPTFCGFLPTFFKKERFFSLLFTVFTLLFSAVVVVALEAGEFCAFDG